MATAVICEFNPFHYGHQYLLQTAAKLTGAPLVAVMSGSFTQRGEVAVTDKFTRASAALRHGADVVVELPAAYAVACAQRFAAGGVRTAQSFAAVDTLAFGCETGDIALLQAAADAPNHAVVKANIAAAMKNGDYYPRALERAVRSVCGDEVADVLTSPNNILAAEYLRALRGTSIRPLPIKRQGAAHDSADISGKFASASYIRSLLRGGQDCAALLPEVPEKITNPGLLDRVILCRLRTMTAAELRVLPEVGEGLENRILEAAKTAPTVEGLIAAVKTKRYTHARLRRILTCALLGVTEQLQGGVTDYVRVLGFTERGEGVLRSCRRQIIASPAKTLREGGEHTAYLALDIRATDAAALAYDPVLPAGLDFCTKMIRVNREM